MQSPKKTAFMKKLNGFSTFWYVKWDNKNFIESERRFAEDNPDNPINLSLF